MYCLIFSTVQDEQKAEDELAKKRAAFLLKQQKKAEEARVRKQQLEAESELKRDEVRWVPPGSGNINAGLRGKRET